MHGAVIYDLVMRLPLTVLMLYSAFFVGRNLYAHLVFWRGPTDLLYVTSLAALIATETYLLVVAAATLLRIRPLRKLKGILPRITAVAAGILPASLAWLPKVEPTPARQIIGTLLIVSGLSFSVVCLGWLGKSFSVMPEARRLVTSGPYRLVRHPIYLASLIQATGLLVLYPSLPALALLTVEMGLQILRMRYEERVLRDTFPEYDEYTRRTSSRLVPGVY